MFEFASLISVNDIDVHAEVRRELASICYPYVATYSTEIVISDDRVGTIEVEVSPAISMIIREKRRTPEVGPPRF